ncbi:hypothetical protein BB561_000719 [Smittium simulii]|uniref:Uncharacterized protein n=1 Tax=Smittium simulii TaxID=133385 RepID=A0A2T9YXV0_9FUNG|nr:hypothetical protein BB561_000719 [Smittium simulii]
MDNNNAEIENSVKKNSKNIFSDLTLYKNILKKPSNAKTSELPGYMSHDETKTKNSIKTIQPKSKDDFSLHKNFGRDDEVKNLNKNISNSNIFQNASKNSQKLTTVSQYSNKNILESSDEYKSYHKDISLISRNYQLKKSTSTDYDSESCLIATQRLNSKNWLDTVENLKKNSANFTLLPGGDTLKSNIEAKKSIKHSVKDNISDDTIRKNNTVDGLQNLLKNTMLTQNKTLSVPAIGLKEIDCSDLKKTDFLKNVPGEIDYNSAIRLKLEDQKLAFAQKENQESDGYDDKSLNNNFRKESSIHPLMALQNCVLDYDILSELNTANATSQNYSSSVKNSVVTNYVLNSQHKSPSISNTKCSDKYELSDGYSEEITFKNLEMSINLPQINEYGNVSDSSDTDSDKSCVYLLNNDKNQKITEKKWISTILSISLIIFMAGICLKFINYKRFFQIVNIKISNIQNNELIRNLSNLDILNNFESFMRSDFNVEISINGMVHSTDLLGRFFIMEILSLDGYFIKIVLTLFICIFSPISGVYIDYFNLREGLIIGIVLVSLGTLLTLIDASSSKIFWIAQAALIGSGYGIIFTLSIIAFYNYYRSKTLHKVFEKSILKYRKNIMGYWSKKGKDKRSQIKDKQTKAKRNLMLYDVLNDIRNSGSKLSLYLLVPLLSQATSIIAIKSYIYKNEENMDRLMQIPKYIGPIFLVLGIILTIFFIHRYDLLDETSRKISRLDSIRVLPNVRILVKPDTAYNKKMSNIDFVIEGLEVNERKLSLTHKLDLQNKFYDNINKPQAEDPELSSNLNSTNSDKKFWVFRGFKWKFFKKIQNALEKVISLHFFKKRIINEKFEMKIQLRWFMLSIFLMSFGISTPCQYIELYAISYGISEVKSSHVGLWLIYFCMFGFLLGSIFAIIKKENITDNIRLKNEGNTENGNNTPNDESSLNDQLLTKVECSTLYNSLVLKTFLISAAVCGLSTLLMGILKPTFFGIFILTIIYGTSLGHLIMSVFVIQYELSVAQYAGTSFGLLVTFVLLPMMIALFIYNSILSPKVTFIIPNQIGENSIPLSQVGAAGSLPTANIKFADNAFKLIFIYSGIIIIFSVLVAMLTFVFSLKLKKRSNSTAEEVDNC